MKSSGIIRKVDDLGRIVIPKEIRRELDWPRDTPLEISQFGGYVLLRAQKQGRGAPPPPTESPIRLEIGEALDRLDDADLLMVLDLLHRLARPITSREDGGSD